MENLKEMVEEEMFRKFLNIEVVEIKNGFSKVKLDITQQMTNIYGFTHGGVIFSLADEAFELACNSRGFVEFGLNVNIAYTRGSKVGDTLYAEARFISESKTISTYEIKIFNQHNDIIASCQAMAYKRK